MRSLRDIRTGRDDLAGDLVAENPARLAAGNFAAAREHVVIADAGGMNAHQHVVGAQAPADRRRVACSTAGAPNSENVTAFIDVMNSVTALRERRRAFLVVVARFNQRPHGFDFCALGVAARRENIARRLVACTAAGE